MAVRRLFVLQLMKNVHNVVAVELIQDLILRHVISVMALDMFLLSNVLFLV